jgi:hypothetical protein
MAVGECPWRPMLLPWSLLCAAVCSVLACYVLLVGASFTHSPYSISCASIIEQYGFQHMQQITCMSHLWCFGSAARCEASSTHKNHACQGEPVFTSNGVVLLVKSRRKVLHVRSSCSYSILLVTRGYNCNKPSSFVGENKSLGTDTCSTRTSLQGRPSLALI